MIELNLPDTFVFWDGQSHLGNSLDGRLIFQHVRSGTVFEAFSEGQDVYLSEDVRQLHFDYQKAFKIAEKHILAVHYTVTGQDNIEILLEKAKRFYLDYLSWEDGNIQTDDYAQDN